MRRVRSKWQSVQQSKERMVVLWMRSGLLPVLSKALQSDECKNISARDTKYINAF